MKKLVAIGYPRASTNGQEIGGYSLHDQVRQIEEFCAANNIELRAHFLEVESAKNAKARPVFQAAIKYMYHGDVDLMVCANLDRFARNVVDNETIRQSLARRGKRIISTQQRYLTPLDSSLDDDEDLTAALQHAAVDNERERKKIKKRLLRGKSAKVTNGGWIGFRPPYEYDAIQGELVLNEERALVVRLMIRLRKLVNENGRPRFSYREIADYLNGNNKLIDPATKQPGRRFMPPHERQTIKKRMKKPLIGGGTWLPTSVWRIVGNYERGTRIKHPMPTWATRKAV